MDIRANPAPGASLPSSNNTFTRDATSARAHANPASPAPTTMTSGFDTHAPPHFPLKKSAHARLISVGGARETRKRLRATDT